MSFQIKNNTNGNLQADGVIFLKGTTKTVEFVGPQIIAAVKAGKLVSTPALTGLTGDADLVNNLAKLTDSSTGTAATITNGAGTIAAVTDIASAKNAIATLAAQVEAQRVTILNLMNVVETERSTNHIHR